MIVLIAIVPNLLTGKLLLRSTTSYTSEESTYLSIGGPHKKFKKDTIAFVPNHHHDAGRRSS